MRQEFDPPMPWRVVGMRLGIKPAAALEWARRHVPTVTGERTWSTETIAAFRADYLAEMSVTDMSYKYDVTESTVRNRARRMELVRPDQRKGRAK
jgi:transposase